jgi:hypothetical protein
MPAFLKISYCCREYGRRHREREKTPDTLYLYVHEPFLPASYIQFSYFKLYSVSFGSNAVACGR